MLFNIEIIQTYFLPTTVCFLFLEFHAKWMYFTFSLFPDANIIAADFNLQFWSYLGCENSSGFESFETSQSNQ